MNIASCGMCLGNPLGQLSPPASLLVACLVFAPPLTLKGCPSQHWGNRTVTPSDGRPDCSSTGQEVGGSGVPEAMLWCALSCLWQCQYNLAWEPWGAWPAATDAWLLAICLKPNGVVVVCSGGRPVLVA